MLATLRAGNLGSFGELHGGLWDIEQQLEVGSMVL